MRYGTIQHSNDKGVRLQANTLCAVFSHLAPFVFSHTVKSHMTFQPYIAVQMTPHSLTWADTDIRLTVKTTAQSVIWADTDIRLTVTTTAYSVIWADTDIRLTVKTTAYSVIWADTGI